MHLTLLAELLQQQVSAWKFSLWMSRPSVISSRSSKLRKQAVKEVLVEVLGVQHQRRVGLEESDAAVLLLLRRS